MTDETKLEPSSTALLVMDYQAGIVNRLPNVEELLERVDALVADVRSRGAHVGWVRVAFDDADFEVMPSSSVMARMITPDRRAAMHVDSPTSQIHERLDPRPHDATVRKTRVGAFTTTDLDEQLGDRGVTTLVLAGVSTSGVVLSTVREAMDRDYRIVVLEDACADTDPTTHTFLTSTLFPRHTRVVGVDDLRELWS